MSQEYNTVPKKQRRTRSPRNRPTLVTNTTLDESLTREDRAAEPEVTESVTMTEDAPTPVARQRSSLLPRFFSKVDKSDQEDTAGGTEKEATVIQARMARARKGLVVGEKTTTKKEEVRETPARATTSPAATRATPNRPPSLFKTRHIIGMAVYLLAAQFILPYERIFAINSGIEKKLADFPFFGFNASITTSFLLNILTLVILLYLLVRFDLLPSGKKLAASQQAQQGRTGTARTANPPAEKVAPKTIREGVKGEHDDLYMAYRNNQRREKKR